MTGPATCRAVRMLASVTSPEEAELAIMGGADLIDLKDPTRGALGALAIETIRAILARVAGRRPTSATIGDLPADPALVADAIRATAATGVDYVKVGLFSPAHVAACLPVVAELAGRPAEGRAAGTAIVAVLFADRDPPIADLTPFARAGCVGLMLDTADKGAGSLRDCMGIETLAAFVRQARGLGLLCGLAGSLRLTDIPALLPLAPDYLGFRGALCGESLRTRALDPKRLCAVRLGLVGCGEVVGCGERSEPHRSYCRPDSDSPHAGDNRGRAI